MKYDLKNKEEVEESRQYLEYLIDKKSVVEIKKKYPPRSLHQNNYCHLLLSYCALIIGEKMEYFKSEIWKKIISSSVFKTQYVNPKTNSVRDEWKSSADLSTAEMTIAIEQLIKWAAEELSVELPKADNFDKIRKLENEIENNKKWL